MPNWCCFSAAIYGDKNELAEFHKRVLAAQELAKKEKLWFTWCLCKEHGMSDDEIHDRNFNYIGGSLDNFSEPEYHGDKGHMFLYMTTRWSPMIDGFNKLLARGFINLKGVYIAEEPGCGIYVNTDLEHKYFVDKYLIYDDLVGSEYYSDDKSLLDALRNDYGKDFKSVDDIKDDYYFSYGRGKNKRTVSVYRFVSN